MAWAAFVLSFESHRKAFGQTTGYNYNLLVKKVGRSKPEETTSATLGTGLRKMSSMNGRNECMVGVIWSTCLVKRGFI